MQRSLAVDTLDMVEAQQEASLAGTELGRECLVGDEVRELCLGTDHVELCRPFVRTLVFTDMEERHWRVLSRAVTCSD